MEFELEQGREREGDGGVDETGGMNRGFKKGSKGM